MGFLSNLFGSGEEETTETVDPYENMPSWLKRGYKSDTKTRGEIMDTSKDIAADLAKNPRQIVGRDPYEEAGLKAGQAGFTEADRLAAAGEGAIKGLDSLKGDYLDPAKGYIGQSDQWGDRAGTQAGNVTSSIGKNQATLDKTGSYLDPAKGFATDTSISNQALGVASDTKAQDAAMAAAGYDMDALRNKYTNQYTGDVVDTTLAGMQRQADRDALAREGKAASVGGTTNTRAAVADAVAGQLTNMNMGTAEAKLRSDAYDAAVKGAHGEAGLEIDRSGALNAVAQTGLDRGSLLDDLANTGIKRSTALNDLANTNISQANAQHTITGDQLDLGDYFRNLGGDELDRSKAMLDIGKVGLDIGDTQADWYSDAAQDAGSRGMSEAGLLGTYGETNRGLDQAQSDADRTAAQDAYGWLGNQFQGTEYTRGPNSTTTTTTTPTASPFQQILGGAAAVAGTAMQLSDERAKEDVGPLAGLSALRDIHPASYSYKDGYGQRPGRTAGLMAQELGHIPGAVIHDGTGLLKVDPYPVLATVVQAVRELDRRTREAA